MMAGLTKEQRDTLWEQFVEAHEKSQEAYDVSLRALAAAGVAVVASLGTALGEFGVFGVAAVVGFLLSLGANLLSYATAQCDLRRRLGDLERERDSGAWGNRWTTVTTAFNVIAGLAFFAGGTLLCIFVGSAS